MSDFQQCRACGEWGWTGESAARFGGHKCAPVWEGRLFGAADDEWFQVHATDAETAAEKFCREYDSGGEYDIIRSGSAEVEVRKQGESEITLWDISAESVPEYTAYERKPKVELAAADASGSSDDR